MGFTFSHPALILPFRYLPRKYYSLSGLIMGSMAPDFEYFLRLDNQSSFSHTLLGIFLFNIPFSIVALLLFHEIMRTILIINSPCFIRLRLAKFITLQWLAYFKKNWVVVICSIFIGTCTHLLWDNFTAMNGYFVKNNTFLLSHHTLFETVIFNYKILKHISSIIGGVVLIYLFYKLPKAEMHKILNSYFWGIVSFVFVLLFLTYFYFFGIHFMNYNLLAKKIISYALYALIFTTVFFKLKNKFLIKLKK